MIGIILGIIFFVTSFVVFVIGVCQNEEWVGVISGLLFFIGLGCMIVIPCFTGVINYQATEDFDRARITAVDTVQTPFRVYYKIDVEYLTNTPMQEGIVTNYRIETDTYYTDSSELVKQLRANMYKEIIIVSGYKGGYETWKTFGSKNLKRIEIMEED